MRSVRGGFRGPATPAVSRGRRHCGRRDVLAGTRPWSQVRAGKCARELAYSRISPAQSRTCCRCHAECRPNRTTPYWHVDAHFASGRSPLIAPTTPVGDRRRHDHERPWPGQVDIGAPRRPSNPAETCTRQASAGANDHRRPIPKRRSGIWAEMRRKHFVGRGVDQGARAAVRDVPPLRWLLDAAQEAGRVVVVLADPRSFPPLSRCTTAADITTPARMRPRRCDAA